MTKHGQVIEVEWMVSPLCDQAGMVIGLSMIARDVTERGRAASALREAQELFRHAFEDAPIGMAILTLDGLYAEVNGAFCQIVGCSAEQLVGASVDSITDPDDVGTERAQRDRLLQGERMTPVIEKRYRHASGGLVDVAVQSTLLRGDGEQPLYFLSQVQDIGVRKRYAEQLEAHEEPRHVGAAHPGRAPAAPTRAARTADHGARQPRRHPVRAVAQNAR